MIYSDPQADGLQLCTCWQLLAHLVYLNNFLLLKYYLARKDLLESFHTSCFLPLMNFSVGSIIVENQSSSSTLRNKLLLASFAATMAAKPLFDLVKAQSDAEEIANKFNVVFGKVLY